MPIYEYQCEAGHKFETIQRISEDPLQQCAEDGCGASAERLVSQSAFILKGGGWYDEGYASTSQTKDSKPVKPAPAEKSTTSTDSAPAKPSSSTTSSSDASS